MKPRVWYFLALFLPLPLSSCSIKEDRTGCPCVLTVDISESLDTVRTPTEVWSRGLALCFYQSDGTVIKADITRDEARTTYDRKVRKGMVSVAGIMGLKNGKVKGTSLTIPDGSQSDRLYLYSETLLCDGEEAYARMSLDKQYSRVRLRELKDVPYYDPGVSFDNFTLTAHGSTNGLDILEKRPLQGDFHCKLENDGSGFYFFNMPRQLDRTIEVVLTDRTGRVCDIIPLGDLLDDAGYDWDAPSLKDVTLYLDRCSASVDVIVSDWETVEEINKSI